MQSDYEDIPDNEFRPDGPRLIKVSFPNVSNVREAVENACDQWLQDLFTWEQATLDDYPRIQFPMSEEENVFFVKTKLSWSAHHVLKSLGRDLGFEHMMNIDMIYEYKGVGDNVPTCIWIRKVAVEQVFAALPIKLKAESQDPNA